jgi:hypothetical protein
MPSDETADALALEKHYTVAQIGKLWGWSPAKVREVFRTEEGVLQSQLRQPGGRKSQQVTLTIPESVLLRVHGRLGIGG